jgi:Spy/CpxP family protein refolding chaperone
MNKLIITIAGTLVLTLCSAAVAQDYTSDPGKKRQHQQRGMQPMPAVEQIFRSLRRLDLDDDQKAGFKSIMEAMKVDIRPIMAETKQGYLALKELVSAEILDEAAIAAIAQKEGQLTAERIMISSQALSSALKLLTNEQRAELQTMNSERQKKRDERRKQKTEQSDS